MCSLLCCAKYVLQPLHTHAWPIALYNFWMQWTYVNLFTNSWHELLSNEMRCYMLCLSIYPWIMYKFLFMELTRKNGVGYTIYRPWKLYKIMSMEVVEVAKKLCEYCTRNCINGKHTFLSMEWHAHICQRLQNKF